MRLQSTAIVHQTLGKVNPLQRLQLSYTELSAASVFTFVFSW